MSIESPWIFRDSRGNVVTELDWGTNPYTEEVFAKVYLEYRGTRPVKVLGFFLTEVPETLYVGEAGSILDKAEVIRWADEYPGSGLTITQRDPVSGAEIETTFESGGGDMEGTAIPYIGHLDGLLEIDQKMRIILTLTPPDATKRQLLTARKFNVGLDISYVEIPETLEDLIFPEGAC